MKLLYKLLNERHAKLASQFMRIVCYFVIAFYILCLILSIMGRQTFRLQTSTDFYAKAIYAEENHNPPSRSFTVSVDDDIIVRVEDGDKIAFTIHIALSVMYAVHIVPLIFAYWFLSRVFSNVARGQIFTDKNAYYLLYHGLLQLAVALLVPVFKHLICGLANVISNNTITISTGSNILSTFIPSVGFIVAAYIIHHGIHLQDEVDHTL